MLTEAIRSQADRIWDAFWSGGISNGLTVMGALHQRGLSFSISISPEQNQITTLKSGDFNGLENLRRLTLAGNEITTMNYGAFAGLTNLDTLFLRPSTSELSFAGATFEDAKDCGIDEGFCIAVEQATSLVLDDATLSRASLDAIVDSPFNDNGWVSFAAVSAVGLSFSEDENDPSDLDSLLTVDAVTVDESLFRWYAAEFSAFAATDGKTLTVIGYGDANKDGFFDSRDLVEVFVAGEYEDGIDDNSYWTEGDWNSDGDFDSSDLVIAFEAGLYEVADSGSVVPEPSSIALSVIGLLGLLFF